MILIFKHIYNKEMSQGHPQNTFHTCNSSRGQGSTKVRNLEAAEGRGALLSLQPRREAVCIRASNTSLWSFSVERKTKLDLHSRVPRGLLDISPLISSVQPTNVRETAVREHCDLAPSGIQNGIHHPSFHSLSQTRCSCTGIFKSGWLGLGAECGE